MALTATQCGGWGVFRGCVGDRWFWDRWCYRWGCLLYCVKEAPRPCGRFRRALAACRVTPCVRRDPRVCMVHRDLGKPSVPMLSAAMSGSSLRPENTFCILAA